MVEESFRNGVRINDLVKNRFNQRVPNLFLSNLEKCIKSGHLYSTQLTQQLLNPLIHNIKTRY